MIKKIYKTILHFVRKAREDSLPAYAAQTTFFVLLSFFPFILLLLIFTSRLSFAKTNIIIYILNLVPDQFDEYILYVIDDIMYSDNNSFTVITMLVSLWSSAKGIQALGYGLDKIYGVEKSKNYIITRLISIAYTLTFMLMCLFLIVLDIFGEKIAEITENSNPLISGLIYFILNIRGIIFFVVLLLLILVIYYKLPDRQGVLKEELPGAIISASALLVMTGGFTFYIRYISETSYMYGSLTSVILIMIWLYISVQIILYGAEINYYINNYGINMTDS